MSSEDNGPADVTGTTAEPPDKAADLDSGPRETEAQPAEPNKPAPLEASPADGEGDELFTGMEMEKLVGIAPGQVVRGHILKVTESEVFVDIGLKSEGAIPRSEFLSSDGQVTVSPGDEVDVWVDEYDEAEGTFTVSHEKAVRHRAWENVEQAFRDQTILKGRALERTKGGLTVEVGVRAFLPGSQADTRPMRDLDSLIGQEIICKVIKLNKSRNNVVVSRKAAMEEESRRRRAQLLEQLTEGAVIEGRGKNPTDYGSFVDLGGMDGLLHITDLSWGRVNHPSEVVQPGQPVQVKVLKFDREKGRVSLGLKQVSPDPWVAVQAIYRVGSRVNGRVVSLTDYGAFVELEPGVEGLIHVSEMTWSKRPKHPSKLLKVGESVDVVVLEVSSVQRRISLSLKQALPDPWSSLPERLAVGSKVQGRVRNLTDFGAFVEIEDGVDGLIHVSDLSWTKNIKHPSEVLKKGQVVEGVVLSLDPAHRRISLGLKQLEPDIWENFFSRTSVGDVLRGKVMRLTQFGAFVELGAGIEGLCHISEMGDEYVGKGAIRLRVGSEHDFRVLRLNRGEKKIGLSLKDVAHGSAQTEATPAVRAPAPKSDSPFSALAEAYERSRAVAAGQTPPLLPPPAAPAESTEAEAASSAQPGTVESPPAVPTKIEP